MARAATRASAAKSHEPLAPASRNKTRNANGGGPHKAAKQEPQSVEIKNEETSKAKLTRTTRKRASANAEATPSTKKIKTEDAAVTVSATLRSLGSSPPSSPPSASSPKTSPANKSSDLRAKKLKSHTLYANTSPFPTFPHPTATEARLAHAILIRLHGPRTRPNEVVASKTTAGCGASPSVLDALVRTILSQNTSDANSTRAKLSMDTAYGGSDNWERIAEGGEAKLQAAIKCGGLSVVKSKVIISILRQVREKYGHYSLDHLHEAETEEAFKELLAFQGVGSKTASCVLLFCLGRESFAVDTHVWRIAGLLGWRPKEAGREATQAHLEVRVPAEDKYGLHVLMVTHGKRCGECRAGGKSVGKCELRKAFRKEKAEKDEEITGEEEESKEEWEA
jgi:endonuclease-3